MKMKNIVAAVLFGCLATPAFAIEVSDTLVIEDVSKVKIETRDTVQRIVISGTKKEPDFHYMQRISIPDTSAVRRTIKSVKDFNKITIKNKKGKPSKWTHTGHFNVGLNTMLNADEGDFKLWPSIELGFGSTWDWHPYGKQNEWSIGWGVNWRYYSSDKKVYWVKDAKMMHLNAPYPNDVEHTQTGLNLFAIQMPLLYTHYFDKHQDWSITLGAIVNWNCYASTLQHYEEGDKETDVAQKKIGQHPFTIDGYVKIDMPHFPAIYCKYCPMEFFKKDRGPKMHQLSFGICL